MTTTTCPNCGKPLRPGTRFCGSCGALINNDRQKISSEKPDATQIGICPHCGKPIRSSAKFCSHCGKEIVPEQVLKPAQTAGSSPQPSIPQPAAPQSKPATVPPRSEISTTSKRKPVLPILIVGLLLLCGLGAMGGFVYFKDPFGWKKNTPVVDLLTPSMLVDATPVAIDLTPETTMQETQPPVIIATDTPLPSLTPELISSLPTQTPTIPPLIIHPITSTVMVTSTIAPEHPSSQVVLLDDDFNGILSTNWKTWGDPRPSIQNGPDQKWLNLKAADRPGRAGVTSRSDIENTLGTSIEFEAQLNSTYPQFALLLDWDPIQFDRGPENSVPTIVHFELQKGGVLFQAPATNNRCRVDLDGLSLHHFMLRFAADKQVELFIDHALETDCTLEIGVNPGSGRISFTGTGWVTRVLVTKMLSQ